MRSAVLSADDHVADLLSDILVEAGYDRPQRSDSLGVAKMGTYAPLVLIIDFDHLQSDKFESLRQLRFVLPDCAIAVVSSELKHASAKRCHLAGASGVISSRNGAVKMLDGLRHSVRTGCYTDPDFAGRHE